MTKIQKTNLPSIEKRWLKHFPEDSIHLELPKCTLYEYVKQSLLSRPSQVGIHYYGTDVMNIDILKNIDNCAKAFAGLGVKQGDIVSFLTVTTPETIYAMYALNKIGAVSNFIDPRMDINRIKDAINDVESHLLITLDIAYPKVEALKKEINLNNIIVVSANDSLPIIAKTVRTFTSKSPKIPFGNKILKWKEFINKGKSYDAFQAPYQENNMAIITYTGGTTGTAKGVMLTDDGLNAVAFGFLNCGVDAKAGDVFLDIMPVFASYGVVCGIHMPLILRFKNVLIPKFTPDELGKLIKKYRPTAMMGVPSFYERIMHSKDLWDFDLDFLHVTGCGGDTMNPGLEKRFNNFLKEHNGKYPLCQGYGMSEVSGAATCCFNNNYKDDSSGFPLLPVTVGIFKPGTHEEVGYNEQGEICITGPTVMKGYYKNQEETDVVLQRHPDGQLWVHSGDIGYIDEDGFVFVIGRIKHMICRFDGHKVFPVQIESLIGTHKAVGTCAVIGIPDPDRAQGMMPLGVIELKKTLEGPIDKDKIRKEIMELCDRELEERGKPIDITIIDEMPHTLLGKNDVVTLEKMYADYKVIR